jgi:hypothetical protein
MGMRVLMSTAMLAWAVAGMTAMGARQVAPASDAVEAKRDVPTTNGIDEVLEWNQIFNATVLATTPAPNSLVTSRSAGLLAAAVFDAVNSIEKRYTALQVRARAPSRTSARAAAIQAAYVMLSRLYPAQGASLTAYRDASLARLGSSGHADTAAVVRGVQWGHAVADSVWTARQSDGFTPTMAPFLGSMTLGFWRPTPPGNLPGSGPQFATMTPWVLTRPSQFRPPPPPALTSAEYAADYNETRVWGSAMGSSRQPVDSDVAVFWSGNGTLYWTRIAIQLAASRHQSLVENAHLFARLHVAMADASLACWDAKYRYQLWRPVTAIRSTDEDGNPGTSGDPSWTPFLTTSAHPEYPSGHANLAGAAATVLTAMFGEDVAFEATAETTTETRTFVDFKGAIDEMADARVYGGMHFRTACVRGAALGATVADYVLRRAMRPVQGH